MKVILDLTEKEAKKLCDVLSSYCDEGPLNEGWQSTELELLSEKVSGAINEAEKVI